MLQEITHAIYEGIGQGAGEHAMEFLGGGAVLGIGTAARCVLRPKDYHLGGTYAYWHPRPNNSAEEFVTGPLEIYYSIKPWKRPRWHVKCKMFKDNNRVSECNGFMVINNHNIYLNLYEEDHNMTIICFQCPGGNPRAPIGGVFLGLMRNGTPVVGRITLVKGEQYKINEYAPHERARAAVPAEVLQTFTPPAIIH